MPGFLNDELSVVRIEDAYKPNQPPHTKSPILRPEDDLTYISNQPPHTESPGYMEAGATHISNQSPPVEGFETLRMLDRHMGSVPGNWQKDGKLRTKPGPFGSWAQRELSLRASKHRRENKRKVLRIVFDGNEHLACPDSGTEKNTILKDLANNLNLRILTGPKGIKEFRLGNGKCVSSVGRVHVPVELPGSSLGRKKRWFYVLQNCPVPLILGMPFLRQAEVLTVNRHLLEACPQEFSNISSLLWIGTPRQRMKCSLDGRNLYAVADTGSDLNFMSLDCAKRKGFYIDRRREARRRIKIGDGTEVETVGQVYVHNLGLDWREAETESLPPINDPRLPSASNTEALGKGPEEFGAIFHILPGLPSDLIFGRDLLDETDAFNKCPELLSHQPMDDSSPCELKILISLGPVSSFWSSLFKRLKPLIPVPSAEQIHDKQHSDEMYRRSKSRTAISLLPSNEQLAAELLEWQTAKQYDQLHATCVYCHSLD
jgi:hypothetical protein